MNSIHNNKVNNIVGRNLLHEILNPSKSTKNVNSHYSPILHGWVDRHKGKAKFNIFGVLLDSGCSSMILIISLIKKLKPK